MTRRVEVLPEQVARKIAAGEVVQRPASVVKELLENSLDAGSTRIVTVLEEGGKTLIQVSDDGSGMDERDALTSFERHATSKIAAFEDLEMISTFGFRGEALASIAAVARVTMKTRRREDAAAVVLRTEGGSRLQISHEAREPGTTVTVQNLFYNVPARRKFLKSTSTEFRHAYDALHRAAISHPEIALEFFSDGATVLKLQKSTLPQRLLEVFGERQLEGLLPIEERSGGLRLYGYISKPSFGLRSRAHQYLFLNGRFILSRTLPHAVFSGYENLLEKGSFPFFLLFLEIDPREVDVNVHPAKLEAKFEDEQGIHRFISSLVRKSLASPEFVPALSLGVGGAEGASLEFTAAQHAGPQQAPWNSPERIDPSTGELMRLHEVSGTTLAARLLAADRVPLPTDLQEAPVWQLHRKYILLAIPTGVMIVDQHVAHERILYERALDRFGETLRQSQQLLFPETIQLSPADASLVAEIEADLSALGFDLKWFGKSTVVVEGVPADVGVGKGGKILEEVLSLYKEYRRDSPTSVRDDLAKSLSCRSAIKAGDPLTEPEMRGLLKELFATRMPYVCPHGRPVLLKIPVEELDRRFGRL